MRHGKCLGRHSLNHLLQARQIDNGPDAAVIGLVNYPQMRPLLALRLACISTESSVEPWDQAQTMASRMQKHSKQEHRQGSAIPGDPAGSYVLID